MQRAVFPTSGIFDQPDPFGRGFGERAQIGVGFVGRRDPRARCVTNRGFERRDRRIEFALEEGLRLHRLDQPHYCGQQRQTPPKKLTSHGHTLYCSDGRIEAVILSASLREGQAAMLLIEQGIHLAIEGIERTLEPSKGEVGVCAA